MLLALGNKKESMEDFREKLVDDDMARALEKIVPFEHAERMEAISIFPDFDTSTYEGSITKEYPLNEELDLSNDFLYISSAAIDEAGYLIDGRIVPDKGDSYGRLLLSISALHERTCKLSIHGTIFIDSSGFHHDEHLPTIKLTLTGVRKDAELSIFQSLVLEGHALYMEKNYRMSFFTLFTAVEAKITFYLQSYSNKIYKELHYALEHLALDDKLRIVCREAWDGAELANIKIWGDVIGLLGNLKKLRNDMAHAKEFVAITQANVIDMFMMACILDRISSHPASFVEIRHHFYPPKRKKIAVAKVAKEAVKKVTTTTK